MKYADGGNAKLIRGDNGFAIRPYADTDLAALKTLFREYAAELDVDLSYQGFDEELLTLPGAYAPPKGSIFVVADKRGELYGCICVRPLDEEGCEMKRLYVRSSARAYGLGRDLANAAIAAAAGIGYKRMLLDTLPSMKAAQTLYKSLGFRKTRPYYKTPVDGTSFMELRIASPKGPVGAV